MATPALAQLSEQDAFVRVPKATAMCMSRLSQKRPRLDAMIAADSKVRRLFDPARQQRSGGSDGTEVAALQARVTELEAELVLATERTDAAEQRAGARAEHQSLEDGTEVIISHRARARGRQGWVTSHVGCAHGWTGWACGRTPTDANPGVTHANPGRCLPRTRGGVGRAVKKGGCRGVSPLLNGGVTHSTSRNTHTAC